jgi:hypothetical protein
MKVFNMKVGAALLGFSVVGVVSCPSHVWAASFQSGVRTLADEGGKKEEKKETMAVDKLPKPVVDGVKKAMPGARITKAAKVTTEGKITYYLDDVKVGKKGWDVTVGEDGTIIKKEECHDE